LSAEPFATCRHCGGVMERISKENESPLIMECRTCAHREHTEIQVSPGDFFANEEVVYRRVVVCREDEQAKAAEVQALRRLIPDLGELAMSETVKRVAASKYFDLGTYPLEEAQTLLKKAEASGFKAILEDPGENTVADQEKHGFLEPCGAPVTVDEPGEETTLIPFSWILTGVALIVVVLILVLL